MLLDATVFQQDREFDYELPAAFGARTGEHVAAHQPANDCAADVVVEAFGAQPCLAGLIRCECCDSVEQKPWQLACFANYPKGHCKSGQQVTCRLQ